MFADWNAIEGLFAQKGLFHMDMRLGRMLSGVASLNPIPFPVIQVLGTNGKGSTSTFLASIAEAHGLKTGLYLSPHFLSIKERVLVNGEEAGESAWLDAANKLAALMPDLLSDLTYFELLTLIAAQIFKTEEVDLAIFEAGMGGRHDATTALSALAHCITPIAMDHAGVLGATLGEIAADKAAAIKPGSLVFSASQYPQALDQLKLETANKRAQLTMANPLRPPKKLGLQGITQYVNGGVALACWRGIAPALGAKSSRNAEDAGLAHAFIPGRMQAIQKCGTCSPLLLDGAHNPHAMQALLMQLPFKPAAIIFSALADKDWQSSLGQLMQKCPAACLLVAELANARAEKASVMAAFIEKIRPGQTRTFTGQDSVALALNAADGPTLACGSLYLLAEIYKCYPQFLKRNEK